MRSLVQAGLLPKVVDPSRLQTIEQDYTTLLHFFLLSGYREAAKYLLNLLSKQSGTDTIIVQPIHYEWINLRDQWGNTALHLAHLLGEAELIALLKAAGADSTIINHQGLTPRRAYQSA